MPFQESGSILSSLDGWRRTHHCADLSQDNLSQEVCLMGWVQYRRDHGGLIFIDLRDREGLTQIVFSPEYNQKAHEEAHCLRSEYVLALKGMVRRRPEGMENPKLPTGHIEVVVLKWKLLNTSKTPPFLIEDRIDVSENLRLQYRYLDIRRHTLGNNLKLRHKVAQSVRNFLNEQSFYELETPVLTKSTPEGARDFIVPSRLNKGEFFALPQSPQLFKQLLMVGGLERYYQIVHCFRDEDLRADRQPEFTQIDLELSFTEEEEIMELTEGMIARMVYDTLGITLDRPFKRMTYDQAIEKYGSDRPDTRFDLHLTEVTDIVKNSGFRLFAKAQLVKAMRVPQGAILTRKEIDDLTEYVKVFGAQGLAWIKIKESEWQSPIAKFLSEEEKSGLQERLELTSGDIVFFQAGSPNVVNDALGNLRIKLGERFELIPANIFHFSWITDFPLLEWDKEEKRWMACHHPFTSPKEEHIDLLESNPEKVQARAYDLVVNGHEIGGGSIRIHRPELQSKMFERLGIEAEEAQEKFGFLLEALQYGAPPHGGIAFGFDRIIMILSGAKSIREVIAFPKTQKGTCLLTEAPTKLSNKQLRELGIRLHDGNKGG
ncbi:MAG TPA: aspartate--tRNA ligase [Desulfohalobiaceae bacterium]|nr:aspartate--tRNA ligase [Desulfohalobiaceae bacterium]